MRSQEGSPSVDTWIRVVSWLDAEHDYTSRKFNYLQQAEILGREGIRPAAANHWSNFLGRYLAAFRLFSQEFDERANLLATQALLKEIATTRALAIDLMIVAGEEDVVVAAANVSGQLREAHPGPSLDLEGDFWGGEVGALLMAAGDWAIALATGRVADVEPGLGDALTVACAEIRFCCNFVASRDTCLPEPGRSSGDAIPWRIP